MVRGFEQMDRLLHLLPCPPKGKRELVLLSGMFVCFNVHVHNLKTMHRICGLDIPKDGLDVNLERERVLNYYFL